MSYFDLSVLLNDKLCHSMTNFVTCDDKLCHKNDITMGNLCHSDIVFSPI